MSIPIFIHHEGAQPYVEDCIKQAKKFNDKVILFGDKSNFAMNDEWIDVSGFSSPLWEEFKEYYKHMSPNGSKFEMMCFKRFFVFDEFMLKNEIEDCISLDSDVLVFIDFSKIPVLRRCDAAFSISEKTQLAWGGHGYWKQKVLHDFLVYCVDIYKNHRNKLNELWNMLRKRDHEEGISDMTLLSWWYRDRDNKIWIWTKYNKAGVMDHNYSISTNYLENEYYLDRLRVGKRVIVKNGKPYFISIEHGPVRACSIHFQGDKKICMHYFRKYMRITFLLFYFNYIKKFFKQF